MRFRAPTLAAVALAVFAALAGTPGVQAQDEGGRGDAPPRERGAPRSDDRGHRSSMSDSVRRVRSESGNQVLSVERMQYDGRDVNRVKYVDENGRVHEVWYGRTVIHSDKRFTYRTAQDVLEGKSEGPFADEMQVMQKIALALRRERLKKGSIEFSSEEVRFKLDKEGKPLEVYVKESLDTNKLIEDYMLLANRYVAQYLAKLRIIISQQDVARTKAIQVGSRIDYRLIMAGQPQQVQALGASITTRSRGRCSGKGLRIGFLRSKAATFVVFSARIASSAASTTRSSSCSSSWSINRAVRSALWP
mgnify:CR=1 FL=1